MRQRSLRKQDSAPHVDIVHSIIVLNAELMQALDALESGVVDEDVDLGAAAQALGCGPLDRLADEVPGAVEGAQVRLDCAGLGVVRQRLDLRL